MHVIKGIKACIIMHDALYPNHEVIEYVCLYILSIYLQDEYSCYQNTGVNLANYSWNFKALPETGLTVPWKKLLYFLQILDKRTPGNSNVLGP